MSTHPRTRQAGKAGPLLAVVVTLAAVLLLLGGAWLAGWLRLGPASTPGGPTGSGERKILFYRNPMNPAVTSPTPAKDDMGMDYAPVYADGGQGAPKSPDEQADDFFADESKAAPGVVGLGPVVLDQRGLSLAGVRTAEARSGTLEQKIRAAGTVKPDEGRVRRVQLRVEGWVERLHVTATGQQVRAGDPLATIYSPEIVATVGELRRSAGTAGGNGGADAELAEAARRRLVRFGLPAEAVAALEAGREDPARIVFRAPVGGWVLAKDVLEGQKVEPGMELITLADLSRVWVEADLYQQEAGSVAVGQQAAISVPGLPEALIARVILVSPSVDPETRTVRLRFALENPGSHLRPGMFAEVQVQVASAEGVLVPDSAIMSTGSREVVFVQTGEGRFEPRVVTTGLRSNGEVLVREGVAPGEKVVIGANFLIDAESRLRAVIQSAGGK